MAAGIKISNIAGGINALKVIYPENAIGDTLGFKIGVNTQIIQLYLDGLLSFTDTAIQPADNFILAFEKLQAEIQGIKELYVRNSQTAAQWGSSVWVDGSIQGAAISGSSLKVNGLELFGTTGADYKNLTAAQTITSLIPTAAGTFEIGGYVNVNAISVDVLQFQVFWTDETGTANGFTFTPMGKSNLISATGYNVMPTVTIRANPATINIQAVISTGGGTVNYNAGATIRQIR